MYLLNSEMKAKAKRNIIDDLSSGKDEEQEEDMDTDSEVMVNN